MSIEDPLVKFKWLSKHAPSFSINGDDVTVLDCPRDFYEALIKGIKTAQHRIVLSALYLGTGNLEKQLVTCLHKTMLTRQENHQSMDVDILIDYARGSRGESVNSKTMFSGLMSDFCDPENPTDTSLQVSLYHSPLLRGFYKNCLPAKWNEIIGLAHLKVFVFDNSLIISGANLSNDYFTQRQDRYIQFNNCKPLADYFQCLVKAVRSFSYHLQHDGTAVFSKQCPVHPYNGDFDLFVTYVNSQLQPIIHPDLSRTSANTANTNYFLALLKTSVDHVWTFLNFSSSANNTLKNVAESSLIDHAGSLHSIPEDKDTMIFPSVQLGFAGINQDEMITKAILQNAGPESHICFTSGYFNITKEYSNIILDSPAKFDIYIASQSANGFLNAPGLMGYIPSMYNYLTRKFHEQVSQKHKEPSIKLYEYSRLNWTYHAKGLWLYDKHSSLPTLTIVGSSNFGSRSVKRDLEAQLTVVTRNEKLMRQLNEEKCKIGKYSQAVTRETLLQPRYAVPRWVSVASMFIRHFF